MDEERSFGRRDCFRLSFFAKKFKIDRSDRIAAAAAEVRLLLSFRCNLCKRECTVSESVGSFSVALAGLNK